MKATKETAIAKNVTATTATTTTTQKPQYESAFVLVDYTPGY